MQLFHRLRCRKLPRAVENLLTRLIEPDDLFPAIHDRQVVGLIGIAAEMDGVTSIFAFLPGDVVDRVGVVFVLHKVPLAVVDTDGPEPVHGDVFHGKRIRRLAVVHRRCDVEILRILHRVRPPAPCCTDHMCSWE